MPRFHFRSKGNVEAIYTVHICIPLTLRYKQKAKTSCSLVLKILLCPPYVMLPSVEDTAVSTLCPPGLLYCHPGYDHKVAGNHRNGQTLINKQSMWK